ncbi:MAG TPA: low-specificity L-threonine aldolase [Ginsengibacter sp.]|nr:low-specificity L-threonine aldolase [Ginsengibacter sp.]
MIDYRSDTVTRPGNEMREAMLNAKVGDDVFGEDPTVNALQEYAASLFGMESALYCPSGTMTNQIAIKAHTRPGDEVVCEAQSHIYVYEGGGIAFNSGCQVKLIPGHHGRITADQVLNAINPDDIHKPQTRLVGLENTSNRGGGSCYDFNEIVAIKEVCLKNGLALHLDGARLFNAIIAKGETPSDYGRVFDSISICLSKGLGAPVGSLLLGNKDFINYARRIRKVFGGGMRQAGIIAAGGLYALKHNIDRLKEDHHHAQLIAEALLQKSFISNMFPVETNILIFEVNGKYSAKSLAEELLKNNIRVIPISPTQIRIVTHLDITPKDVDKTIHVINTL